MIENFKNACFKEHILVAASRVIIKDLRELLFGETKTLSNFGYLF